MQLYPADGARGYCLGIIADGQQHSATPQARFFLTMTCACEKFHKGEGDAAAYATLTTNGNQVSVTDTQATQTQKFYRVDISLP